MIHNNTKYDDLKEDITWIQINNYVSSTTEQVEFEFQTYFLDFLEDKINGVAKIIHAEIFETTNIIVYNFDMSKRFLKNGELHNEKGFALVWNDPDETNNEYYLDGESYYYIEYLKELYKRKLISEEDLILEIL